MVDLSIRNFYYKIDAWQIDQEPNDPIGGTYGGTCRDSNDLPNDPNESNCDEGCEKVSRHLYMSGFIWDIRVGNDHKLNRCDTVSCTQETCEDKGSIYITFGLI